MPFWKLYYHIVWGTKNRLPLIEPAWEAEIYGYMWGKAVALGCIPHAINGMMEHTHVVVSIPPKLSVAAITGQLKGASSHRINEAFVSHHSFAWQAEYGVFSFSEKSLQRVVEYVKNQKIHHAEKKLIHYLEFYEAAR